MERTNFYDTLFFIDNQTKATTPYNSWVKQLLPNSEPHFDPFKGRGRWTGIHKDKDNYPKWNTTFLLWANYSPFQNLFFRPLFGKRGWPRGGYPTPVEFHEFHEDLARFHLFKSFQILRRRAHYLQNICSIKSPFIGIVFFKTLCSTTIYVVPPEGELMNAYMLLPCSVVCI